DKPSAIVDPKNKGDEYASSFGCPTDGYEPLLGKRPPWRGSDLRIVAQDRFDLCDRNPVLLALLQIPRIPIETGREKCRQGDDAPRSGGLWPAWRRDAGA